jgi:hypothetical protein
VIEVGKSVIVNPSQLGNYKIADTDTTVRNLTQATMPDSCTPIRRAVERTVPFRPTHPRPRAIIIRHGRRP